MFFPETQWRTYRRSVIAQSGQQSPFYKYRFTTDFCLLPNQVTVFSRLAAREPFSSNKEVLCKK